MSKCLKCTFHFKKQNMQMNCNVCDALHIQKRGWFSWRISLYFINYSSCIVSHPVALIVAKLQPNISIMCFIDFSRLFTTSTFIRRLFADERLRGGEMGKKLWHKFANVLLMDIEWHIQLWTQMSLRLNPTLYNWLSINFYILSSVYSHSIVNNKRKLVSPYN